MDVVSPSIDVRDLLSTADSDPSTPLSVPDLRLLIDRLQIRSLHIKDKVRDYVVSHHRNFTDIFSHASSAASRTNSLSRDVSAVVSLLSYDVAGAGIGETVREIGRRRRELGEKKEMLSLVQTIVNLVERLRIVREELSKGRLVEAAEGVRGLKKAVLIGDDDGDGIEKNKNEPVVYSLLRKEWRDCFDEMQGMLVRLMDAAVEFDDRDVGKMRVRFRVSVGELEGVELGTILTAMEVMGVLDYGLAKVADLFVKFVVIPAVSNGSHFDFVEELDQGTREMEEAVLCPDSSNKSEIEISSIYPRIIQIVKFVYNFLCLKNDRWMKRFGRLTWPRISELIISQFLSKSLPDDASKLSQFQKIIELTSEFETALQDMKFISVTNDSDRRLSAYTQNVEVHFASRKKIEILAKARNILLQCDFSLPPEYTRKTHTFKAHGVAEDFSEQVVELLFLPANCIVSKAGAQLMELVHQTLQDVCMSSDRVSMEFYHAARDALLLYEAIIPVKLDKQLNSINEAAIIVHNDCLFLSQEILGLAFEYRSNFPSYLKEQAVFVDMAPRLHQMADKILQRQIRLVIFNLKEALDGADGFQNTHQMQHYESAKLSIDQVIFIIEKVRILWEPLLLPPSYKRSMGSILDFVFSRLLEDILLLDDMAAKETLQLQRLIQILLENLSPLFEALNAIQERNKLQEDVTHIPLDVLIPSLPKLSKLADLLDMPLKSITIAWESQDLVRCGYMSSEVENLVKAIFTDSPLRKECLWRIGSIGW